MPAGPLRIAQLIQTVHAQGGGTSTAFLQIFQALAARPDLAPRAYAQASPPGDPSLPIIARYPGLWMTPARAGGIFAGDLGKAVIADISAARIDLLHIHGLWSSDLAAAALAAQRRGIPVVWNPHGMLVERAFRMKRLKKQIFLRMGLGRALRGASALVFASAVERDTSVVLPGTGHIRREVIPLPVDIPADLTPPAQLRAEGRARFNLPSDAPVIVFLGRLHPVKRIGLAIEALAHTRNRLPGARLLLLGSGDAEEEAGLRRLASERGLADAVVFAGWLDGADKWRGLAAGDCLTLQSMFENFGYVALEAAAMGRPVVMTDNLSLAQEAVKAGAGVACAAEPAALGEAWVKALSLPDRAAVAAAGRAWVQRDFSAAAVAARMAALYHDLAARPGPNRGPA
ncbi:MAG: glycosyltransferase [Phycisphaerales bacterium]|nr:glycosyltransferase [Phycisphaerales bacterium]